MLSKTQLLSIELGHRCNLARVHAKCPANLGLARYDGLDTSRELDNATIQDCVFAAYIRFGFTGLVAWHFYNEPCLELDRMLELMTRIRGTLPRSRFCLWTNGTIEFRPQDFDLVHVSDYRAGVQLDERLAEDEKTGPESDRPCVRPFSEFVLDAFGNHHPCCADFRGGASLGNVFRDGFATLVERWARFQDQVCGVKMAQEAPQRCRRCVSHFRQSETGAISGFDAGVRQRAEAWRTVCSASS